MPKRTIRNNSNKVILFNQTLKDIEHRYRDVAGYDMNFDEFEELCRNQGRKIITIFILIDVIKEIKENIVFVVKAKKNKYRSNTTDETFLIIIQNCNLFQKQTQYIYLCNCK